jgi:hypothetical protein
MTHVDVSFHGVAVATRAWKHAERFEIRIGT